MNIENPAKTIIIRKIWKKYKHSGGKNDKIAVNINNEKFIEINVSKAWFCDFTLKDKQIYR